jgi:hypothetical protein
MWVRLTLKFQNLDDGLIDQSTQASEDLLPEGISITAAHSACRAQSKYHRGVCDLLAEFDGR